MEYWSLGKNPTGRVYQSFINTLCNNSDEFYFFTLNMWDYNQEFIDQFKPYIKEARYIQKWGTTILYDPKTVYFIVVNRYTRNLLLQAANSLYDWIYPLPEDLSFIKNNCTWFTSTTHERFGGFSIHTEEQKNNMLQIKGLDVVLNKFVTKEPYELEIKINKSSEYE